MEIKEKRQRAPTAMCSEKRLPIPSLSSPSHYTLYVELLKDVLNASLYDESAWVRVERRPTLERQRRKERSWLARKRSQLGAYITQSARMIVIDELSRRNLAVVEKVPFDKQRREIGRDWPLFGYTMIGRKRLDNLQACVEDILRNDIPGDLIETGVWRGGATIFMRALLKAAGDTKRNVWLADSFAGMPVPQDSGDGWDLSHVEQLSVSLEQVKNNFERFGLLDEQVRFLKGWFSDTLPSAPIERLALLRLDGDLYSSTTDALEALYPKVSKGGFVICDDYGSWPSCKRAVDDFLLRHDLDVKLQWIDEDATFWRV